MNFGGFSMSQASLCQVKALPPADGTEVLYCKSGMVVMFLSALRSWSSRGRMKHDLFLQDLQCSAVPTVSCAAKRRVQAASYAQVTHR